MPPHPPDASGFISVEQVSNLLVAFSGLPIESRLQPTEFSTGGLPGSKLRVISEVASAVPRPLWSSEAAGALSDRVAEIRWRRGTESAVSVAELARVPAGPPVDWNSHEFRYHLVRNAG